MKKKEILIEIICVLFILLFTYASIGKFLEYSDFVVQLHKSPMLVDLADIVAWLIPSLEIVTCILLVFSVSRVMGLYASLLLMSIFTFYIIAILGYSEYVPCSCGGVLQTLGWKEHLIFNIVFCVLAVIGILLQSTKKSTSIIFTGLITVSSLVAVFTLFRLTYQDNEKYSSFNKRSFHSSVEKKDSINLEFNSYYFAGAGNEILYLGNETAPHILTTFNSRSLTLDARTIHIESDISLNSKLTVLDEHFYLHDGTKPTILFGTTKDLVATPSNLSYPRFTDLLPLSTNTYAFRISDKGGQQQLAISSLDSGFSIRSNTLRGQIDGRFDIDGMLLHDKENKRIAYIYFYRNQFIELDTLVHQLAVRNTIDTVRTAKIKISTIEQDDKISTVVIPTLTVNLHASVNSGLLFIQSNIRAKNESIHEFENSIRLDVYHLTKGIYLSSFNITLKNKSKVRDIKLLDNYIYLLIENSLMRYDVTDILMEIKTISSQRNFTGQ